jgi:hypothetical protein
MSLTNQRHENKAEKLESSLRKLRDGLTRGVLVLRTEVRSTDVLIARRRHKALEHTTGNLSTGDVSTNHTTQSVDLCNHASSQIT